MENVEALIGLEIHARLKTKSKMFCSCSNDIFEKGNNESICPVCTGFPGVLPVVNEQALKIGVKTALALKGKILPHTFFDRKSYFYPDLPHNFQISQYDYPISEGGSVDIYQNGEKKSFAITRLHLENDAGKNIHEGGETLVNLNRAGTPLAEIVTEPVFHSPEEVGAFLRELRAILRYLNASDADMEKGMMRCDVNVNLVYKKSGEKKRTEISELKNMNSFRAVERAIAYEIKRQKDLIIQGKEDEIIHETRGWDDAKGKTLPQRRKEEAHDYRYFPEPDIPPFEFDKNFIEDLKKQIPELPSVKIERFENEYNLSPDDALKICDDLDLANFYDESVKKSEDKEKVKSFILSSLLKFLSDDNKSILDSKINSDHLSEIISEVNAGSVSMTAAKDVLKEVYENGGKVNEIIDKKGLKQVSDSGEIEEICDEVLEENKKIVDDILSGKGKAFGALVGAVMKKSKGKANPRLANEILNKKIEKLKI